MTPDTETERPTILAFVRHYLPGHKYGGATQSMANLVQVLGDEFSFKIVTRDRDYQESVPYLDVNIDAWNRVGKAQVFYCAPESQSLRAFRRLMCETPHDTLYLNSFFDPVFTTRPLLLVRCGLVPARSVVLVPRGEFSRRCLAQNAWKKMPFVLLAQAVGLYRDLIWQAASKREAEEIRSAVSRERSTVEIAENIFVAADVNVGLLGVERTEVRQKGTETLRILFLSRICRTKNLDGALRSLADVKADVQFNIYGPLEDKNYWKYCEGLMRRLPRNVRAGYHGSVDRDRVSETMAQHDLLFLPSHSESFGHVILEALNVGTPVLTSDQTPWTDLEQAGVGWNFPVHDGPAFTSVIGFMAGMDCRSYSRMREDAVRYASDALAGLDAVSKNRDLFLRAFRESQGRRLVQSRRRIGCRGFP